MRVLLASLMLFVHVLAFSSQTPQTAETRLDVKIPAARGLGALELSPDGDKIVTSGDFEGKPHLWLHSLSSGTARPLPGTDDITNATPCWSPDSRSIAYFVRNGLKRIELEDGSIRLLTETSAFGRGCSWNRDGTILFALSANRPIFRISEDGGPVQPATPPDPLYYESPYFLPDGRHFLFYAAGSGVLVGELGGAAPRIVMANPSPAIYSPSGHLLFVRQATFFAQRFDTNELKLTGEPFVIARQVPPTTISSVCPWRYRIPPGAGRECAPTEMVRSRRERT